MANLYEQNILSKLDSCSVSDRYFYDGMCYFNGINCPKNRKLGLESYVKGSKLGRAKCKYGIAISNLKQNPEAALINFKDAFPALLLEAENNDDFSQRMVSCYYYFGNRGVQKDLTRAIYWLERAVSLGNIEATFDLAMCFENGDGVDVDIEKALSMYQKASNAGFFKATLALNKYNITE